MLDQFLSGIFSGHPTPKGVIMPSLTNIFTDKPVNITRKVTAVCTLQKTGHPRWPNEARYNPSSHTTEVEF
jgi:hypothetical protein